MKQKAILIFVLLCGLYSSRAQENVIDSLTTLLNRAGNDSTKVDLLNQLSPKVFSNDPELAFRYANQAYDLGLSLRYRPGYALALKNLGLLNYFRGTYDISISYGTQALKVIDTLQDDNLKAMVLSNIGASYFNMADDSKAIEYYLRSLKVAEDIKDTLRISMLYSNIGAVYFRKPALHDKALEYYLKALPLLEKMDNSEANGTITVNLGEIYLEKGMDSVALFYFNKSKKYLENSESLPYTLNAIGNFYSRHKDYRKALDNHLQALNISRRLEAKPDIILSLMGVGDTYMKTGQLFSAINSYKEAEAMAKETRENEKLKDAYKRLATSYAATADYKQAYQYQSLLSSIQDVLYNDSTAQKINNLQFDFEMQKKQVQIDLLTKDKDLRDLELRRQKVVTNALIVGVALIFIIGFIIYRNYRAKVETNKLLDRQKAEIERLLLNILPTEVAHELQKNGFATPRYYENVSVMFTDFKNFTILADRFSPQDLVAELNDCFIAFDAITQKYNLEKIKTIGDAYMCAGGIPTANDTHPVDIIKASREIQEYILLVNQKRIEKGVEPWHLRIGVHSGPIVAGVVGKTKYAYDIWGSTVNIANRMESNGEPGQVNISSATYEQIKHKFACTYRGKIYAKNVGEVDMYFVDHEIPEQSIIATREVVDSSVN